jgi:uncharacterized zinc-type alcohol dehydrogenase-like protein
MNTRGYAVLKEGSPLEPYTFNRRELKEHDVAFDITHAGICHSDIHTARSEWGTPLLPLVPGHEIVGVVTAVGSAATKFAIGDRIGVGVFVDSCGSCENCLKGLQNYCAEGMTGTYNGLERDGVTPALGGYSNKFVINENYAVKIPANLDMAAVAPLLCAGITLYSPLRHWNVKPGMKVGVIGLGGLGHMGVKLAAAMGAHVTVFSHSAAKEADARSFGAHDFVLTKSENFFEPHKESFDLVLNTVSAEIDINSYLHLLKTDGTLVVIGLPGKPYALNVFNLLRLRRSIAGSMIGGMPELQEMLDFCGEHNIVSEVEVIKADYINEAYERTIASDVRYRFVIDATSF